jgi:hypothetical protein
LREGILYLLSVQERGRIKRPLKRVHCKKKFTVFLSPAGMSLARLFLAGNNFKIPGQEEFGMGDIPAGDGKTDNLF